jgi:hypothetical protein
MRKPAARGVGATGYLKLLAAGHKARYGARGLHRPVRKTLFLGSDRHNGPVDPSFERAGILLGSLKISPGAERCSVESRRPA